MSDVFDPRPASVYVSWPLFKALGYVAKASDVSRDRLAHQIILAWLQANHSDVLAFLDKREDEENEFRDQLKTKLKTLEREPSALTI
jgi:hypothetical protein